MQPCSLCHLASLCKSRSYGRHRIRAIAGLIVGGNLLLESLLPARRQLFSRKQREQTSNRKGPRPDIQGLRAFAVIVVILDHLLHWPRGGFIGVDVFFVISGFLITGHLMREYDKTGHISFVSFYKKRAKRILPAAALALAVTTAFSYFAFNSARFQSTVWDGFWGLFFGANWRFAATGTDYFQADGPVSPLQHFWSLAVEEQFYFVWPWVLLLGFTIFLRGNRASSYRARHTVAGVAIGVVTSSSLAWAIWETETNAGVAYFSTISRGWELGIGAGLAVAIPLLHRLPNFIRPLLAWSGTIGLFASLFVIDASTAFPAPAALLPTLSAAAFIAANTGREAHSSLFLFTNPVSGYIGNISYSLYLWHFPVIILSGEFIEDDGPFFYVVIVAAIVSTSVFSYHLWEDFIRRSGWLSGNKKWRKELTFSEGYKRTALGLLAVVTLATTGAALMPRDNPTVPPLAKSSVTTGQPAVTAPTVAYGPEVTALQTSIKTALTATEWPELSPTLDAVIAGPQVPADITRCGGIAPINEDACTWGDTSAPRTAVIIGDSVALTYVAALRDVFKDRPEWKLSTYATFGCTYTDVRISSADARIAEGCPAKKDEAVAAIKRLQPDIVFVTHTYEPRESLETKSVLTAEQWEQSTQKFVESFAPSAKKIVFLAPPPSDADVKTCYSRVSTPSDCVSQVTGQWFSIGAAEERIAAKIGGAWVDSSRLFCDDRGVCPSFVGTTPTKMDKVHITADYAQKIAPGLAEELTLQKLL